MPSASQIAVTIDHHTGALGATPPSYVNRACDQATRRVHDFQLDPGASVVVPAHTGAVQMLLSSVPRAVRVETGGGEFELHMKACAGPSAALGMTITNDLGPVEEQRRVNVTLITVSGRETL
jgi:hypothetical protein